MRIGLLGSLEVSRDGVPVALGGARLHALLALLALDAGRLITVERLIDDLWEERPPFAAPNALQSLVSRLRTVLGRAAIESGSGGYRLVVPPEAVDAHDFEKRVVRARTLTDPAERAGALRAALELWRGPALAGVRQLPCMEGPVARLEGLRQEALEARIEAELAIGRHAELVPELAALVAADPLREPLRGRLMRALYGAGRPAEALAVYEETRRLLAESLGMSPSAELERLHLAVLRQEPLETTLPTAGNGSTPGERNGHSAAESAVTNAPGQGSAGTAGRSGDGRGGNGRSAPHNLRARLTSFIGRDEDVNRVGKLVGEARLVTLIGPGGAGKTRLSQESAERLLESMPDGVWLVELAPLVDPAEVLQAVAGTLGLREAALVTTARGRLIPAETADPLDRLAAAIGGRRMLLLLDNCEHLLDAVARLADRLLALCSGLRVLATSREPLGITGETLWPVGPLALPAEDAAPEEAVAYPAVRLLVDRAAAVRPGFAVTEANVGQLIRICRALDGMPLAIELAAARLRALTAAQLAERLDDRFRLLKAGSRTALPRHQTLRAVAEWSWDLLDDAERRLWRRLSVFAGGATVEAAEAVCFDTDLDTQPEPEPEPDVFELLTALVDKSLVVLRAEEAGSAARYLQLETIKAYGRERLAEAGEEERLRRAHARYFLEMAERGEPRLRRHDQAEWLARLSAEHDNTQAALRWAISRGHVDLAVRFCAALGWYWWLRGHSRESSDIVGEVLAMPGLPATEATALAAAAGAFAAFEGPRDHEEIKRWLRLSLEITETLGPGPVHPLLRLAGPVARMAFGGMDPEGMAKIRPLFDDPDPWVVAMSRFMHGQIALNTGRVDVPDADFAAALEGFRALGDRWGVSFALTSQAEMHAWRGEHREAVALFREALRLIDELGIAEEAVWHIHARLANQLALLGEYAEGEQLLRERLRSAERRGSPEMQSALYHQLGEFARRAGDHTEAERLLRTADAVACALDAGPGQFRAMIATSRAMVAAASGDRATAREHLADGLRRAVLSWDNPIIAQALVGYADLAEREGEDDLAAEVLGMSDGIRGMPDRSLPDVARIEAALRTRLGDDRFTTSYHRGNTASLDQVLARFNLERPPRPAF